MSRMAPRRGAKWIAEGLRSMKIRDWVMKFILNPDRPSKDPQPRCGGCPDLWGGGWTRYGGRRNIEFIRMTGGCDRWPTK